MENWVVATSNFPVVFAVAAAWTRHDMLSAGLLVLTGLASFTSHLFETHKHGMPGAFKTNWSISSNVVDRAAVVLCCLRCAQLFWYRWPPRWLLAAMLVACAFNLVSEWDKTLETKTLFIVTHCVWHIAIFSCIAIYFVVD